jgi:hypothetical protein
MDNWLGLFCLSPNTYTKSAAYKTLINDGEFKGEERHVQDEKCTQNFDQKT